MTAGGAAWHGAHAEGATVGDHSHEDAAANESSALMTDQEAIP